MSMKKTPMMNQEEGATTPTRRNVFHTLLVFRAPTTLSEALAQHADQKGTSISAVIRELLLAGLKGA